MIWFYAYVHPYLLHVLILAVAASLGGYYYAKQYRAKPAKYCYLAALVLDLVMVAAYSASLAYSQSSNDAAMAALWLVFAFLTFRSYRQFH